MDHPSFVWTDRTSTELGVAIPYFVLYLSVEAARLQPRLHVFGSLQHTEYEYGREKLVRDRVQQAYEDVHWLSDGVTGQRSCG